MLQLGRFAYGPNGKSKKKDNIFISNQLVSIHLLLHGGRQLFYSLDVQSMLPYMLEGEEREKLLEANTNVTGNVEAGDDASANRCSKRVKLGSSSRCKLSAAFIFFIFVDFLVIYLHTADEESSARPCDDADEHLYDLVAVLRHLVGTCLFLASSRD